MKVYVSKEEWYPVYDVTSEKNPWDKEIEMDVDTFLKLKNLIEARDKANDDVRSILFKYLQT